jgi:hypothetical protein
MAIGERVHQAMQLSYDSDVREGVSISAIGYCELQTMNLFMRKEKKSIGPANLLAMRTGTATHASLFSLLWKYRGELEGFVYKKKEVEVSIRTPAGNTLRGHLDLIAEIDGKLTVCDLKVIDEAPFQMLGDEARQHEIDQVMMYAAAIGIEDCLLVYLCKGGRKTKGLFKEYPFAVDHNHITDLLTKYDRIVMGNAQKPFQTPDESWECGYCSYYIECWGAKAFAAKQDGTVEISPELEERYIAAKANEDQAKSDADEIKDKIVELLDGKRGEGSALSAWYVVPKPSVSYDKALLERLVPPDLLKKCAKPSSRNPYYTLKIRGE